MDFHGGEIKDKIEYDFSVNLNPLGMPKYVKNVLKKSVELSEAYPDRLCRELRNNIAAIEGVNASQVLCGNGASELIMSICAYLAGKSRIRAGVMSPTFSGYERAVCVYGGEVSDYCDYDELLELLKRDDNLINLVFICNPNNPTGEIIDRSSLEQIIDISSRKNINVVVDECFIDFTYEKSVVDLINSYRNLFVIKAFTKFYSLAGVRLGYVCANSSVCDELAGFLPEWNVSSFAQMAGIEATRDINRSKVWKIDTLSLIDAERAYLFEELTKLGVMVFPSAANFILCRFEDPDIWEKLRQKRILVRDCSNFKTLDSTYVRACISTHKKNEVLVKAIKEIVRG